MKYLNIIFFAFFLVSVFSSCEPLESIEPQTSAASRSSSAIGNNQLYLNGSFRTSEASWATPSQSAMRVNYDPAVYRSAKGVVFSANLAVEDESNICAVRLYNFTDNQPIALSEIVSEAGKGGVQKIFSADVLASLPEKKALLGVQAKSSNNGQFVSVSSSSLRFKYD